MNAKALHEEDIAIALADQFGLRYVVVDVKTLSPDLAALMPERTARRLGVLPLSASGDRVRLVVERIPYTGLQGGAGADGILYVLSTRGRGEQDKCDE